jgi:NADH:ubiquinone oxidoreductase subunit 2 (subunit N)
MLEKYLLIVIMLTTIVGGLGALIQTKISRFIAFSVIMNNSFLLAAVLAGSATSFFIFLSFIAFYFLLLSIVFVILQNVKGGAQINNLKELIILKGHPLLAFIFAFTFLALAGLPPFTFFIIKFTLLSQIMSQGYLLLAFLLIGSIVTAYYYIRIIKIINFSTVSRVNGPEIEHKEVKAFYIYPISKAQSLIISLFFMLNILFLFFPKFMYMIITSGI